ncbi:hypothetical protein QYE76_047942 [Lolium multiflorum]|uniref:Uncharacterized protein n=1 Tax=Lolium multiflorum TaxID=4521 RepID=A0AAD8X0N0_LOLMU|nr:hypothetical protein QYE76_047942 [Lolium multiflorum]
MPPGLRGGGDERSAARFWRSSPTHGGARGRAAVFDRRQKRGGGREGGRVARLRSHLGDGEAGGCLDRVECPGASGAVPVLGSSSEAPRWLQRGAAGQPRCGGARPHLGGGCAEDALPGRSALVRRSSTPALGTSILWRRNTFAPYFVSPLAATRRRRSGRRRGGRGASTRKAAPQPSKRPRQSFGSQAGSDEPPSKKPKITKPPPLNSKKAERERLKMLATAGKRSRPIIPGAPNVHYELHKNIALERRVIGSSGKYPDLKNENAELNKQLADAQGASSSLATTSSELENLRSSYQELETKLMEAEQKKEQAEKQLVEKNSESIKEKGEFLLKRNADSETIKRQQKELNGLRKYMETAERHWDLLNEHILEPLGYPESRQNLFPRDDLLTLAGDDCKDLISASRKICHNLSLKKSRTCGLQLVKKMDILPELVTDLQASSARGAAAMTLTMCLAHNPEMDLDRSHNTENLPETPPPRSHLGGIREIASGTLPGESSPGGLYTAMVASGVMNE